MPLGFAPNLLGDLRDLTLENYPGMKITPAGFLRLLIENNPNLQVGSINGNRVSNGMPLTNDLGHIKEVKVKYKPRIVPSQVREEHNCDNQVVMQYTESEITAPRVAEFSFYKERSFLSRYMEEATQKRTVGTPPTGTLRELVDDMMHVVNGLIGKIDLQVTSDVNWGVNVATGLNTAQSININKDATVLDLSNGVLKILADAQVNELMGELLIAGSGLMNNYEIMRGVSSADGAGIDRKQLGGYKWYYDLYAPTSWGANQVGVFAPGTVGFVDIDNYIAFKAGKLGNSWFTRVLLPVQTGNTVTQMWFDLQIKEYDCPVELFDGYETRALGPGYQFILSKNYGLWQAPSNSVQATDRLFGANGSLRYVLLTDRDWETGQSYSLI